MDPFFLGRDGRCEFSRADLRTGARVVVVTVDVVIEKLRWPIEVLVHKIDHAGALAQLGPGVAEAVVATASIGWVWTGAGDQFYVWVFFAHGLGEQVVA